MIRKVFLTLIMALPLVGAMAQTDFAKEWNDVNKLYDSEDYNKAYSKATKLFALAQKSGDSRNMITGAFQMARIAAEYQENAEDSALTRYFAIMDKLDVVDKAVCHAFVAKFYSEYSQSHRWVINRNKETDESELDYKLWPQGRFDREIKKHLTEALKDEETLQKTDIKEVGTFCEKSNSGLQTTPTLYDLMINIAVESTNDYAEKMRLLQKLIDFHSSDGDCLRIWLDIRKYELLERTPNAVKPTVADYERLAEKYKGTECDLVTMFHYEAAKMLNRDGKYVEAKAICNKAIALFPKSKGAENCANLIKTIEHPECTLQMVRDEMADHAMLAVAESRNADMLYFRIIKTFDHSNIYEREKIVEAMAKQSVVEQWTMPLMHRNDHKRQKNYVYMPPVPTGEYYLLVSTSKDFKANGLSYGEFVCCDAQIVTALSSNALRGYVVLRGSGEPIEGQKMRLERYDYSKGKYVATGATAVTDKDGYYEFDNKACKGNYNVYVATDYKGVTIMDRANDHSEPTHNSGVELYCQLDRPVYKLGETISFAYVVYQGDHRTSDRVCEGAKLYVRLRDVNDKTVDSVRLTTDEFGVCHGELKVPSDALPGHFSLYTTYIVGNKKRADYYDYYGVKVEEYKQPKFTVKMYGDNERHEFGKELTVNGLAASYSQVPIDGAKVSYTVVRREMYRPWRWWYMPVSKETTIAGGETKTDGEGKFEIHFTPMPDSSVELANKPCFVYQVTADVTDINGETHSQTHTLRVGYENSHITLPQGGEVERFDTLSVDYSNLDGDPIEGSVTVVVERLVQPTQPRLAHEFLNDDIHHSLSHEGFDKRFGLLAYDKNDVEPDQWATERKVMIKSITMTKKGGAVLPLGNLEAGVYRVTATAINADGSKVESKSTYTYMPCDADKVQTHSLVWVSDCGTKSMEVGDTYRLKVGSRYKGVKLLYMLSKEGESIDRRVIELDNNVKTIEIPIVESYKGGVRIDLFAMKENQEWKRGKSIDVPYSDKRLDVKIETFRDKLQPGEQETWTIRVSDQQSGHRSQITGQSLTQSNLMLTMYDAALDTYGSLNAYLWPWVSSYNPMMLCVNHEHFSLRNYQTRPQTTYVGPIDLSAWRLLDGVFSRSRSMFSKNYSARGRARGEDGMVEEVALMAKGVDAVMESGAAIENAEYEEAAVMVADEGVQEKKSDEPQLRTNLNTLAFFKPTLRTGDDGTVECTFTVPELLTEWSIRGVAHTKDMKTGSLSKSLITQKELMVQPNAPRFLRQGDTVDFLAKVVNMTDKEQTVTVSFDLFDPSNPSKFKIKNSKLITIPAKRSEQVSFRIAVPHNIYVANYRIVAKNDHFSDGEQDCMPVLTDRQMVTVSQAMYINGVGEKSYTLPTAVTRQSATREPHLLKVEFTSNPIWYAIQALPYVEEHKNPSNIFLANRLYTNSIAFDIVSSNPNIESVFRQWEKDTVNPLMSQLEKNEDVKQTLLDETPWLRDGTGESQRMHRIAVYFDKSRLTSELKTTEKKLLEQQRSDGGWSWIPGYSQSSLYTTQYILEILGKLAHSSQQNVSTYQHINISTQLKKALKYVDDETYDYYRRYLKHTDFEALNIDYLYMRSFYTASEFKIQNPKHKESYDYFYRNTLKHYKEYKSLHTRATLALVFHRGGNSKEALDILRRIKESSLYSDEMGMYWRDNQSSWWWYERPIETQALLIQAFAEITPDDKESIALMQQWLLKQKQTTSWSTDVATVEAINALLSDNGTANTLAQPEKSTLVTVAGQPLTAPSQAGTGYQSQSWHGDEIAQLLTQSHNNAITQSSPQVTIKKYTDGIAWGAAYYQYFDDMKNIERSDMGVKMSKTIYRVKTDGTLEAIPDNDSKFKIQNSKLKVGDRVRIRILLDCDRALEYVELKDSRPGCLEPVSTASGWNWNSGLSYYSAVRNASNSFYINRLDKGKYVVEYDLFVTNPGAFTVPASTIQCLYAPEFRANSEGRTLYVK